MNIIWLLNNLCLSGKFVEAGESVGCCFVHKISILRTIVIHLIEAAGHCLAHEGILLIIFALFLSLLFNLFSSLIFRVFQFDINFEVTLLIN